MNSKKIISPLLIVVLFFCSFAFGAKKAHAAISITTCLELQDMESDLTADYVLENDIDCTGVDFQPIGDPLDSYDNPFTGTLDGQGFSISNLVINQVGNDRGVGLFEDINGGTISNLILASGSITSDHGGVGAVAGYIGGAVSDTTTIIDNVESHLVINIVQEIIPTFGRDRQEVGGLVGGTYNTNTLNISDSSVLENISNSSDDGSTSDFGGLVGYFGSPGSITNSSFEADITITSDGDVTALGGLVGRNRHGLLTITDSHAKGNITTTADLNNSSENFGTAGLIGYLYADGVIDNSYFEGNIEISCNYTELNGGLVGYVSSANLTITGSHVTGGITINTEDGIYGTAGFVGYWSGNINGSINDSYFDGNLDFSTNNSGIQEVGGLVGTPPSDLSITDSHVSGEITLNAFAGGVSDLGGLVAYTQSGSITNSYNTSNVAIINTGGTNQNIGGLVGYNALNIIDSYNSGNINIAGADSVTDVGGIHGYTADSITLTRVYSEGDITIDSTDGQEIGGLVGGVPGANILTINESYSNTNISAPNMDNVGGLVGNALGVTSLTNTFSWGDVTGDTQVGGLVGFLDTGVTISNSYSTGSITGNENVGGFIGEAGSGLGSTNSISDSFSAGLVSSGSAINFGGFLGFYQGTLTLNNNFFDITKSNEGLCGSQDGSGTANCTGVDDANVEPNYFFDNNTNAPLDIWDFGTTWKTSPCYYPTLIDPDIAVAPCGGGNTAPSVSTLGPANVVDGSSSNHHQPTFTFITADSNGGDTVKFRIIIDNNSDFSSPLVDYTSALATPGSSAFTVGQTAGGGTYSIGSPAQTLPDGSYYWEVKAIDNSDAESVFSTANSGAVAFDIDTPASGGSSGTGGNYSSVVLDVKVNGSDGPVLLPYPESYTYTWTSNNATSCELTSPIASSAPTSGSSTYVSFGQLLYPAPDKPVTLSITCTNGSSSASDSVVINLVPPSTQNGNAILVSTNIVCSSESDFPNWDGSHEIITSATANNFLANHPNCHAEPNAKFQIRPWGSANNPSFQFNWSTSPDNPVNTPNPGIAFTGEAPSPWITLPSGTDINGIINYNFDVKNLWHVYIRKILEDKNVSEELYCNNNILGSNNFSRLDAPFTNGQTLYCVSFNAPKTPIILPPTVPAPLVPPATPQPPLPPSPSLPPSVEIPETTEPPTLPPSSVTPPAPGEPEVLPASTNRPVREIINSSVSGARKLLEDPTVRTFGGAAIALPLLASLSLVAKPIASGAPAANVLSYIFFFVPQLLRFRRSPRPWGSVYDSGTKRPLPFTRVEILNSESRKLESTITDPQGRYGFLVAGEFAEGGKQVELRAEQKDYTFPSREMPTQNEKILYPNIYQGGLVSASQNTTNFDLPMDPLPDVKNTNHAPYFGIVSVAFNNFLANLSNVLFILGLIFGIVSFILSPTLVNLIPVGLILLTSLLRVSGFSLKSFGLTKDKDTNKPLAFGLLALHDSMSGQRVNFTVSDASGRYFLLSPSGKYILKAYTPAHVSPMREVDIPISTHRGWVSREIEI